MTESVSEPQEQSAALPADAAAGTEPQAAASADGQGRKRSRRGGRGRNKGKATEPAADAASGTAASAEANASRPVRTQHPLLAQLAQWHPNLFGEQPLPLKRGIFEDLLAAHPEAIDRDQLKLALSQHTRSSRYLTVVASGQARHDLQGQSVEAMAPEHVHHALIEVFRRRQHRSPEDLAPKLRNRIIAAYEASGLSRDDYAARVQGRDEATNTLVAEALAEADARTARDEALLRAFEASGQTSEAGFADMYGMNPRQVAQQLERAPPPPADAGGLRHKDRHQRPAAPPAGTLHRRMPGKGRAGAPALDHRRHLCSGPFRQHADAHQGRARG